ncbi:MAG: hypothetical protein JWQ87_3394 [Candidatus Sulfotelmatobacter sp.]|nr:hypothetical protein [Candidatus Sulfotelmatobacter sp.]
MVADGRRAEFEAAFAVDGTWATLLYQADGYLLTEVWCESPELAQYRVKDFWNWHRNFESFRARFHVECERFENWVRADGIVKSEQLLGMYYEELGGEDESVLT